MEGDVETRNSKDEERVQWVTSRGKTKRKESAAFDEEKKEKEREKERGRQNK